MGAECLALSGVYQCACGCTGQVFRWEYEAKSDTNWICCPECGRVERSTKVNEDNIPESNEWVWDKKEMDLSAANGWDLLKAVYKTVPLEDRVVIRGTGKAYHYKQRLADVCKRLTKQESRRLLFAIGIFKVQWEEKKHSPEWNDKRNRESWETYKNMPMLIVGSVLVYAKAVAAVNAAKEQLSRPVTKQEMKAIREAFPVSVDSKSITQIDFPIGLYPRKEPEWIRNKRYKPMLTNRNVMDFIAMARAMARRVKLTAGEIAAIKKDFVRLTNGAAWNAKWYNPLLIQEAYGLDRMDRGKIEVYTWQSNEDDEEEEDNLGTRVGKWSTDVPGYDSIDDWKRSFKGPTTERPINLVPVEDIVYKDDVIDSELIKVARGKWQRSCGKVYREFEDNLAIERKYKFDDTDTVLWDKEDEPEEVCELLTVADLKRKWAA